MINKVLNIRRFPPNVVILHRWALKFLPLKETLILVPCVLCKSSEKRGGVS